MPYVDVTLTPGFAFQDPAVNSASTVALSFVVADGDKPCTPSWGTYYGLDAAGTSLDLDRRITQLRAAGGDVVVSFGGLLNDELAVACTDSEELLEAYRSVVERYELSVIDLGHRGLSHRRHGLGAAEGGGHRGLAARAGGRRNPPGGAG